PQRQRVYHRNGSRRPNDLHRPGPHHQREHRGRGRIRGGCDRFREPPEAARRQFRHQRGVLIMKTTQTAVLIGTLALSAGCSDFLDVNTNPNAPQAVSANLYLPPMLHWMVTSPQFDGRFVGRYTQQWTLPGTSLSTWDRMGYDPSSDNGAQQWRDVYWSLGQNLVDMTNKAQAESRWDLLGVALVLKAWGWQVLTDLHG